MELWDLYDAKRNPLNKTHVRGTPMPEETYHIVADTWTITKEGQVLITQRHPSKPYGLKWECTGGSVLAGESSVIGALRELSEEVGIKAKAEELILLHSIKLVERFVDTYITRQDITLDMLTLQAEEVVGARLVSFGELDKMWQQGTLVPRVRYGIYRERIREFIEKTRD